MVASTYLSGDEDMPTDSLETMVRRIKDNMMGADATVHHEI